ncbi:MAG: lysylphosphatidylglycerol synthase domain-containing protein [Flavobacterium haoranii]
MIAIPHKAKQFLLVLVKVLIVGLAFFYIYQHLQGDKAISLKSIVEYLSLKEVLILLLFTSANWFFEVLKWQNLVNSFKQISFFEAAQQTFGSLTASIFTPNRIGEYGAKMLYFKKENAKRIVLLNFVHNSSQMLATTLFGVIGMFFSTFNIQHSTFKILVFIGIGIAILIAVFFRKIEIYGFSIQKIIDKIKKLDKNILFKTVGFSIFRYIIFSTQFLILLLFFDAEIEVKTAFLTIFTMYFLASILPSIHLMDVAIKGSVALFLFSKLGVEDWKILTITSLMWFFNLVLPVILGSYFVMRFKPKTTE